MRVFQQRAVAGQLAFSLIQRGLKGGGVNFHERVARAHHLAFLIMHLHELAIHAAFHRHRIERRYHPQRVDINPDVAPLRRRGTNHDRQRRGARARPCRR